MSSKLFPLRTECPPGACVCERDALLQSPQADTRVLLLTREEENRLVQRLERLTSLQELRHMQERMQAQLGIRLEIGTSGSEVRTLRVVTVLVLPQPGLCRKTRQALMARNQQLQAEVSELRDQLAQNTLSLIEIVKAVKINSIIPVESLLANHVIRELHKSS